MQGTATPPIVTTTSSRIIPAYAGNRNQRFPYNGPRGDHPCVCREQKSIYRQMANKSGSSLRMQGTAPVPSTDFTTCRIIPAYAGNSRKTVRHIRCVRDHPCVCREQKIRNDVKWSAPGSSLRMQGTGYPRMVCQVPNRIIPAYAGNSESAETSPLRE